MLLGTQLEELVEVLAAQRHPDTPQMKGSGSPRIETSRQPRMKKNSSSITQVSVSGGND
jgi:hypothetical protein